MTAARELTAVCALYGATVHVDSMRGIYVVVDRAVRIEWLWSFAASAVRVETWGLPMSTHTEALPARQAEAYAALASVLADPAFTDALHIALTRLRPECARAMTRQREREAAEAAGPKWTGD